MKHLNRKIIQISNSSLGLTLDQEILKREGLKKGDKVDVELTKVEE